jgi:hypothetical protein
VGLPVSVSYQPSSVGRFGMVFGIKINISYKRNNKYSSLKMTTGRGGFCPYGSIFLCTLWLPHTVQNVVLPYVTSHHNEDNVYIRSIYLDYPTSSKEMTKEGGRARTLVLLLVYGLALPWKDKGEGRGRIH